MSFWDLLWLLFVGYLYVAFLLMLFPALSLVLYLVVRGQGMGEPLASERDRPGPVHPSWEVAS